MLYYMSVTPFPNPRTTNFIPEAWDFSILTRLANFIVTYPIAQNANIAFQTVYVPSTATLTKMANTSYVGPVINSLLTALNTWTALNTFGTLNTNAITTNTITATTLALSGTQLDTPMTTNLTYNIIPFTLAPGTYTYGTAGQIGYTVIMVNSVGYLAGPTANTDYNTLSQVSLTQGVWLLSAEVSSTHTNTQTTGIGFNTTSNTFAGGFGYRGTSRSTPGVLTVQPFVQLSTSAVYYASGAVTMYLLMACEGYGLFPGPGYLTAVRIA